MTHPFSEICEEVLQPACSMSLQLGTDKYEDMKVQIFRICDLNDPKKRENFWIHKEPKGDVLTASTLMTVNMMLTKACCN